MSQQIGWSIEAKLLAEIKKVIARNGGTVSFQQYASTATFPAVGKSTIIYLAQDEASIYYWDGAAYQVVSGAVTTTAWGAIVGTLSNQTDLQSALDGKVDENAPITPGTGTKVTYDAKGLVTSSTSLAASDIPSGIDASKIADGSVSSTEFQYINTVTSNVQTQLDSKAPVSHFHTEAFIAAASDETTALTTGTAKVTFRMPYAFTITGIRLSASTAPTGAALIVDIKEAGVSLFSTLPRIDAGSTTSVGSATPYVITDTSLADNAVITIDITQIGSTIAGAGLKVYIIGHQ